MISTKPDGLEWVISFLAGLLKSEAKQALDSKENEKSSAKAPSLKKPIAPSKLTINIVDIIGDRHLSLSTETFFTPNGVYVLVFDLSKELDGNVDDDLACPLEKTYLEYIHEILMSIHLRVAHSGTEIPDDSKILGELRWCIATDDKRNRESTVWSSLRIDR